jgi:uncharacterized RmlC-like cupin family protein
MRCRRTTFRTSIWKRNKPGRNSGSVCGFRQALSCLRTRPYEPLYRGWAVQRRIFEEQALDWREHGVKIVHAGELDTNTPQTPGMTRAAAITHARTGATKLWAGTVLVQPHAKTGPHHHGELETVLYIVRGRARMRWGDRLEFCAEADPGDFIYVPPYVPHQEINARSDMPCEAVVVRSGQDPVVVNLDIESPEPVSDSDGERPFHPGR